MAPLRKISKKEPGQCSLESLPVDSLLQALTAKLGPGIEVQVKVATPESRTSKQGGVSDESKGSKLALRARESTSQPRQNKARTSARGNADSKDGE